MRPALSCLSPKGTLSMSWDMVCSTGQTTCSPSTFPVSVLNNNYSSDSHPGLRQAHTLKQSHNSTRCPCCLCALDIVFLPSEVYWRCARACLLPPTVYKNLHLFCPQLPPNVINYTSDTVVSFSGTIQNRITSPITHLTFNPTEKTAGIPLPFYFCMAVLPCPCTTKAPHSYTLTVYICATLKTMEPSLNTSMSLNPGPT